jgi:hypothetical protein
MYAKDLKIDISFRDKYLWSKIEEKCEHYIEIYSKESHNLFQESFKEKLD